MFSRSSDTMFSFLAQCSSCLIFFSPILFSGDENKIGDFEGVALFARIFALRHNSRKFTH